MFGVYVHIPFCKSKCFYCSFPSIPSEDMNLFSRYVKALLKDLCTQMWCIKSPYTIYIGGGTPSIFSAKILEILLQGIRKYLKDPIEFSIEVNPESLDEDKLKLFYEYGVTRLSIGVQSFNDATLKTLGRIHTAKEAKDKILLAKKYFENINLDLIFAFPGQGVSEVESDVKEAISFEPTHISAYSLSVEEGTPLANKIKNKELSLPSEEEWDLMFELVAFLLKEAGFTRYEISNYAKAGYECIHNINYWKNGEYLGVGAASVSHINKIRIFKEPDPLKYIEKILSQKTAIVKEETLSFTQKAAETIIMQLRTREGFDLNEIEKEFKVGGYFKKRIDELLSEGLLEKVNNKYRIPEGYIKISNQIMSTFID